MKLRPALGLVAGIVVGAAIVGLMRRIGARWARQPSHGPVSTVDRPDRGDSGGITHTADSSHAYAAKESGSQAAASPSGAIAGGPLKGWSIKESLSWLSALTVLLYLLLRLAYATFYSSFGLKPEDVGLAQTDILAQSALGVALVVAVAIVAAAVYWYLLRAYFEVLRRPLRLPWGAYREPAWPGSPLTKMEALYQFTGLRAVGNGDTSSLKWPREVHERMERMWVGMNPFVRRVNSMAFRFLAAGRYIATGIAATVGLSILVVGLFVGVILAHDDALSVRHGEARHVAILGFQLLSFGADPVEVRSKPTAAYSFSGSSCLMFLGQANGTTILYDVDAGQTLRVPSNDVVILATPDRQSCK